MRPVRVSCYIALPERLRAGQFPSPIAQWAVAAIFFQGEVMDAVCP